MEENKFDKKNLEQALPEANDVEKLKDKAEECAGFHVKPWGFDEVEKLNPVFEQIILDLKKRKIGLKDFYQRSNGDDGKPKIEIINFDQLYFVIMPHLRALLSISININPEDVSAITPEQSTLLITKIIQQNIGYLKNWLALAVALMARVIA